MGFLSRLRGFNRGIRKNFPFSIIHVSYRRQWLSGRAGMNIAVKAEERTAFDVVSPVDGQIYARRFYADARQIEAALARAEAAAKGWARTPVAERIAVVTCFGEEMAK